MRASDEDARDNLLIRLFALEQLSPALAFVARSSRNARRLFVSHKKIKKLTKETQCLLDAVPLNNRNCYTLVNTVAVCNSLALVKESRQQNNFLRSSVTKH